MQSAWLASTAAFAQAQGTINLVSESVRAAYLAGTRSPTGAPGEKYWQVRPHYALDVRLVPDSGYVAGEGTITVANPSPHAWDSLVLRLDLNRFQSDSRHHGGMVLRSVSINALSAKAEPVWRWQLRQWQQCVNSGGAVSR